MYKSILGHQDGLYGQTLKDTVLYTVILSVPLLTKLPCIHPATPINCLDFNRTGYLFL